MGGRHQEEVSENDTALLESVLSFYDQFGKQNATNSTSKLQSEAAWAYRKVGALYQRLGRDDEAEASYAHAIQMFEDLIAGSPSVAEYRFKLVETCDMADPWTADASSLERLEKRLRRATGLIDQLVVESPKNLEYILARIHVHAKLGAVLHRLKRLDEAEACYRQAITIEGETIGMVLTDRPQIDRATTREALAMLQIERGKRDEARTLLEEAAADLESLTTSGGHIPPPLNSRYKSLAEAFESLGETDRAQEMTKRAAEVDMRPPPEPPGRFGRRPGPPPPVRGRFDRP